MCKKTLQKVIAHSKKYGYVFPSSEIYEGLQAIYDYGPNGIALKNNIKAYWWKAMVQMHENIVGIDSAILAHPKIWKASGHIDAFNDPYIDNKDSKKRYRAETLIEEKIIETKNENLVKRFKDALKKKDLGILEEIIEEYEIVCPISGSKNWTEVRRFDLMFHTKFGSLSTEADTTYLRPETAQGIFVNFLNVLQATRQKIPFGIAQIGKAFRNEIVARQFIFRMKEFEQMEMQFFIAPDEEKKWYEYWKSARMRWHLALNFPQKKYRYNDHLETAHYAKAATDIEFDFPFGFKELEGIHSRTDFDLKNHQEFSGKKLHYFDTTRNQKYIPFVIETSMGLDRMVLAVLCQAYTEQRIEDKIRIYLDIHPVLAPVKAAVFPLTRKDNLPEKARNLTRKLRYSYEIYYEEKDTIGKRYARQDLIGTPFCFTIDHQTLQDDTITIRERNTTEQFRKKIAEIPSWLENKVSFESLLKEYEPY